MDNKFHTISSDVLFALRRDSDRVTIRLATEEEEGEKTGFKDWRRNTCCKIDSKSKASKKCVVISGDFEFVKLYKKGSRYCSRWGISI